MPAQIYSLPCSLCGDKFAFSFEPYPAEMPKVYCLECTILIAELPEKFNIKRYDVHALKKCRTPTRLGALSKSCNFMFMRSNIFNKSEQETS